MIPELAPALWLSLFFAALGGGEAAIGHAHPGLLSQGLVLAAVGLVGVVLVLIVNRRWRRTP